MKRNLTLLILIAAIGFSCERTQYAEEIQTIDSLRVELDSSARALDKIDTTGLAAAKTRFTENLYFVQKTYSEREDTMPRDVALLMSEYRSLKKPSTGFLDKYVLASEELEFSKTQLRDLKHDLQNNLLDTNLVEELLTDERKAVEKVVSDVKQLELSNKVTRKKRAEVEPRIDSLIQELKKPAI